MYVRTYVFIYICLYGSNIYIYIWESMYNPHSIPMKPSPAPRFPPLRTNPASQRHGAMDPRNPSEAVRYSRRFMSWWVLWRYRYIIIIIIIIIILLFILLLLLLYTYIYNQTYSMCIYIYIHGTSPYIQFHSVIDQSMCLGYVYIYTQLQWIYDVSNLGQDGYGRIQQLDLVILGLVVELHSPMWLPCLACLQRHVHGSETTAKYVDIIISTTTTTTTIIIIIIIIIARIC